MVIAGLACAAAAIALIVHNKTDDLKASEFAQKVVSKIDEYITHRENPSALQELTTPEAQAEDKTNSNSDVSAVELEGYRFMGYLTIADLNLKLPVMSEWSYDRLKISPCRFSGSAQTDNLVIAAHNYDSHFGRIGNLRIGAQVLFSDMNGDTTRYEVVSVDTLNPVEIDKMTSGDYDLSLFTCTLSGMARVTVRCNKM